MQSGRMITIALISGFVGAGLVWFTWSLLENVFARGGSKKAAPPPAEEPEPEKPAKDGDKPAAKT